jgi:TM2 domain-containing membrane protein YozV
LAGSLKIAFWIAVVILFWTGIPVICRSIRHLF